MDANWADLAILACAEFDADWTARYPEGPDGTPPENMISVHHEHAAIWRKVRSALAAHKAAMFTAAPFFATTPVETAESGG